MDDKVRAPGRPRCEQTHQAIIVAAQEVLQKQGFEHFTIEALAAKAKVSKATIYRRWPNRIAVLLELIFQAYMDELSDEKSCSCLYSLLLQRLRSLNKLFVHYGHAMASIIAVAQRDPKVNALFSQHYVKARRQEIMLLLDEAIAKGELADDCRQDELLDVVFGPLFYRLLISRQEVTQEYMENLVKNGLRLFAPAD